MKVYLLWVKLDMYPHSALVGIFASREAAEQADENTKELGDARHHLRRCMERDIQEIPLIGAAK